MAVEMCRRGHAANLEIECSCLVADAVFDGQPM